MMSDATEQTNTIRAIQAGARRRRTLLVGTGIVGGMAFVLASFVIAVYAVVGVKSQQNFLCNLIGTAVVSQQAQLDSRLASAKVFAEHDASPQIRARYRSLIPAYTLEDRQVTNRNAAAQALGGHCASQVGAAQAKLRASRH